MILKKSLGQNFLKNKTVLAKIIKAADLQPDNLVLEVGPGKGILTEELVKYAGYVIAIEIDNSLAQELDFRFRGNDKVEIINEDILKINLPEIIERAEIPRRSASANVINYKVIANIPYYITSPIIQLFLETKHPPQEMILMVQKEVAERITAKPGDMSILAVSVQYCARAELLFNVPRSAFWPVPEVDSAVIRITHRLEHLTTEERKQFFKVVKAGFAAKRKTLLNNLSNSFHLDKSEVEDKIKKIVSDPKIRAQELSVEEWKKLYQEF